MVTDMRDEQVAKALLLIVFTEVGIEMVSRDVHERKALLLIVDSDVGKMTEVREVQS